MFGCGRRVASDAAQGRAESAQADFANFQRRIHSLPQADGTWSDQIRNRHHSLAQAPAASPDHDRTPILSAHAHRLKIPLFPIPY
jgi:hypothetical protein